MTLWNRLRRLAAHARPLVPTFRYWLQTEVHVYAFSVAANVLLSFFPFLIVMVSLCKHVLKWSGAEKAIYLALSDFFPDRLGEFLQRNLEATVALRGAFQVFPILLLLFTANGIFVPMEVALNRVWGASKNRAFWKNQLVALGLIFACGVLALVSTVLTALNREFLASAGAELPRALLLVIFKAAAIPLSIVMLLLVYWLLPNCKIAFDRVAPVSVIVALLLELLKYINLLAWPWLRMKLSREYGPFAYSVTVVLWGFVASMLVLAGAEWSARVRPPFQSLQSHSGIG